MEISQEKAPSIPIGILRDGAGEGRSPAVAHVESSPPGPAPGASTPAEHQQAGPFQVERDG